MHMHYNNTKIIADYGPVARSMSGLSTAAVARCYWAIVCIDCSRLSHKSTCVRAQSDTTDKPRH